MTNWKTTLTLLFLVVGLGLWVWLGEPQLAQKTIWDSKTLLRHLKQDQVVRIDVVRPADKLQLAVEREDASEEPEKARWRMTSPVADQADDAEVRRFLNNLEFAQFQTRLVGPEARTFERGEVLLQFQLVRKEGAPYQVTVYEKRPSGEHPVEVQGREGLYLVRGALIEENFPKTAWAWRTKQVLTLAGAGLVRVEVERPDQPTLALVFADGFWRLDGPEGEFARKERVEELLGALRGVRATEVESDAPRPEDLDRTGLASPAARLKLEAPPEAEGKAPRHEVLMVGSQVPGRELHWLRTSSKGAVYQAVAGDLVAALEGKPSEWVSDALLPLSGSAETVTGLGFKGPEGEWVVQKDPQGTWAFQAQPKVPAAEGKVKELVREVVGLRVLERLPEAQRAAVGLEPPAFQLGLDEGALHRELHIGAPVEGRPGVYHVARAREERVFLADLGLLPERLRDAQLELIESTMLKVSEFTIKRVKLLEPDGTPVVEAELAKAESGPDAWNVTTQPGSGPADPDVFKEFVRASFVMVPVIRWVALDSDEARRSTGLDAPRKVVLEVETFEEGKQDPVRKERTLLLGRREGARIHALNPEHAPAIGLIDATFLDKVARGFGKGEPLLSFDKFTVRQFQLHEGDATTFDLRRTEAGSWYLFDQLLSSTNEVEKLLERFERLEVTRAERATPERLAATGLDAPARRLTVLIHPFDESPEQTLELLLGQTAGEREVWATQRDGKTLGALFDEPLRALEQFLADHPRGGEDPFATPPGGGSEAPVASPTPPGDAPPGDTASVDSPAAPGDPAAVGSPAPPGDAPPPDEGGR